MTRALLRHLLLSLFVLAGQTSGLLCELGHASEAIGHASEAIGHANGAPGRVNDPLEHVHAAPGVAHDHSGAPELVPSHCHRCLLLTTSAMPSNDSRVVRATAPGLASLSEGTATSAPRELALHHRLARGPPDFP